MSIEESVLVTPDTRIEGVAAADESARLASVLVSLRVGANDAVAILMWNDVPFFTLSEACRLVGAYMVPLNWHLAPPELRYILSDCGAKVLFGHDALLREAGLQESDQFQVVALKTPAFVHAAYPKVHPMLRSSWPQAWRDWTELLSSHLPLQVAVPGLERGAMIYTSGTTGRPKGVVRDPLPSEVWAELHGRSMLGFGLNVGAGERRVTVQVGPLYHSAPNAYSSLVWRNGGIVSVEPRFDAERLLAEIERQRVTHIHLVPIMIKRLLDLPQQVRNAHDLSSLVSVCHGAAPCPPDVKRAAIDWLGPIICEYYAGTETGIIAFATSAEWVARPGTVGRAAKGVDVRVIGNRGQELRRGQAGELIARSASTISFHYHQQHGKKALDGWDGYLSLGDIGHMDDEGFIFLSDRSSDMIISGGVNIYPAEIESQLTVLPGVQDCVVFGVPDAEYGEAVYAIVQPQPGVILQPGALREVLRTRIATYKVPRVIELRSDLPREDSGKIRKRLLRDEHWRDHGAKI